MKSVTYREAVAILNKTFASVSKAAEKGTLTLMPFSTPGSHYLSEEQVKLFVGKRRISLYDLNSEERDRWFELRDEIEKSSPPAPVPINKPIKTMDDLMQKTMKKVMESGKALFEAVLSPECLELDVNEESIKEVTSDPELIDVLNQLADLIIATKPKVLNINKEQLLERFVYINANYFLREGTEKKGIILNFLKVIVVTITCNLMHGQEQTRIA
jgi:hypothetical protein